MTTFAYLGVKHIPLVLPVCWKSFLAHCEGAFPAGISAHAQEDATVIGRLPAQIFVKYTRGGQIPGYVGTGKGQYV